MIKVIQNTYYVANLSSSAKLMCHVLQTQKTTLLLWHLAQIDRWLVWIIPLINLLLTPKGCWNLKNNLWRRQLIWESFPFLRIHYSKLSEFLFGKWQRRRSCQSPYQMSCARHGPNIVDCVLLYFINLTIYFCWLDRRKMSFYYPTSHEQSREVVYFLFCYSMICLMALSF